jgi:hypothetical protein
MAPETTFVSSAKRTSNTKKPKAEKRIRRRRSPAAPFAVDLSCVVRVLLTMNADPVV